MRKFTFRRLLLGLWVLVSVAWLSLPFVALGGEQVAYPFKYYFFRQAIQKEDEDTWTRHLEAMKQRDSQLRAMAAEEPWRSHPRIQSQLQELQAEIQRIPAKPKFNPYDRTAPSLYFLLFALLPPLGMLLVGAAVWHAVYFAESLFFENSLRGKPTYE